MTKTTQLDEWITPRHAAEILRIDEATVRNWCRKAEAGMKTRIKNVRRTEAGNYLVGKREIVDLLISTL